MSQTALTARENWRVAEEAPRKPHELYFILAIGLLIGLLTGAVIALFRIFKDSAYHFVLNWTALHKTSLYGIAGWMVAAFAGAVIVGWLIRNPAIRYGGASWIGNTLANGQKNPWLRILLPKFLGSWLVLSCGVSVGSEGPCIQMGAATAVGLKKFSATEKVERKYFILGGCAAGLAAAFSAPFAGVCYVYEIMQERFDKTFFIFLLAGGTGVYLSCTLLFGLDVMLPMEAVPLPGLRHFWLLIPLGLFAAATGIAYNYLLRWSIALYDRQKLIPQFWRPVLPFLAAGILLFVFPAVTGEGTTIFNILHEGPGLGGFFCFFIAAKLIFTAFCYGAGIPAGLMVPILCMGGVTGAVFSDWTIFFGLLPPECAVSCVAMGMAGAFAAAERAPVTGLVLVLEMTGAYAIGPGMLLVAAIASVTARICRIQPV